jgi:phenylalanyl-tRNA synthetase beta chain
MQFSEQWLRTYVNPEWTTERLAHELTMAGLEVEETRPVAPPFSGVVVGRVVSFEAHPNADRLRVCQVQTSADSAALSTIVCGAPNVESWHVGRLCFTWRAFARWGGDRHRKDAWRAKRRDVVFSA